MEEKDKNDDPSGVSIMHAFGDKHTAQTYDLLSKKQNQKKISSEKSHISIMP